MLHKASKSDELTLSPRIQSLLRLSSLPLAKPRTIWRQVVLCCIWALCFGTVWLESDRLWKSPRTALFIFYQPVAHALCMLWLWAVVVLFFERRAIRYDVCFASEHHQYLLPARSLAELASAFTTILAVSAAAFVASCARGAVHLAGIQPMLMYVGILAVLLNPSQADRSFGSHRWFFIRTLRRVLLPFQVRSATFAHMSAL